MRVLTWIAAPLLLLAGAMLIVGIGSPALWIALVAIGIAVVAIDRSHYHHV
jgi:hypothetical protein